MSFSTGTKDLATEPVRSENGLAAKPVSKRANLALARSGMEFGRLRIPGVHVITSGLVASFATVSITLPWSSPWALAVVPWLLLPIALGISVVLAAGWSVFKRTWHGNAMPERYPSHLGAEICLQLAAGSLVLAVGFYLSNVLLVDEPIEPLTLGGYGTTVVAMLLVTAFIGNAIKRSRWRDWIRSVSWRNAFSVLLLVIGVGLGVLDSIAFPFSFATTHRVLLAVTLTVFVAVARLGTRRLSPRGVRVLGTLTALVVATSAAAWTFGPRERMYTAIVREPGAGQRTVLVARSFFDRDRDGFSPVLGGGDCDDHDPATFPLSLRGRDCLGWMHTGPTESAVVDTAVRPGPRMIVLITIDAFRCGFGVAGAIPQFTDACPNLTRRAREGRFRADAHTPYPSTLLAMEAMNTGRLHGLVTGRAGDEPALADNLRLAGFRTHAIVTHRRLLENASVRRSFASVDDSLVATARQPAATTADAVTLRLLERVRMASASHERQYVWAHYYDPHAPYVEHEGSHWSISPIDAYAAEVRRTDAAIERFFAALETSAMGGDTLVIVTADHGEEFGEHGAYRHGVDLYEPATRIPVIAWSSGEDHHRFGSSRLPFSSTEVFSYVLNAATGTPFRSTDQTLLMTMAAEERLVGWIDDGWKLIYHRGGNFMELYDLAHDQGETIDRATSEPARVRAMGAGLARAFAQVLRSD